MPVARERDRDERAHDFHDDEHRRTARANAGERVGERSGARHRRGRQPRRRREPEHGREGAAHAERDGRPERPTPKRTSSKPNVATTSPSHRSPPERVCVDSVTAERPNIRLATITPAHPPTTCAPTYTPASRDEVPPRSRSAR